MINNEITKASSRDTAGLNSKYALLINKKIIGSPMINVRDNSFKI
jgi:hypothetical protein